MRAMAAAVFLQGIQARFLLQPLFCQGGHAATHSPSSASDMEKPVETLKNMNLETAKHAQWVVRVLAPKLIRYSFQAEQKTVQAEKFQCLLVANIPHTDAHA